MNLYWKVSTCVNPDEDCLKCAWISFFSPLCPCWVPPSGTPAPDCQHVSVAGCTYWYSIYIWPPRVALAVLKDATKAGTVIKWPSTCVLSHLARIFSQEWDHQTHARRNNANRSTLTLCWLARCRTQCRTHSSRWKQPPGHCLRPPGEQELIFFPASWEICPLIWFFFCYHELPGRRSWILSERIKGRELR